MLILKKESENYIIVTAFEFAKFYNYTIEIYSKNTQNSIYISPNNLSTSNYYDRFKINCFNNIPISLTGSNVNIHLDRGLYIYRIYDTPTQYQLDVNGCEIVETGLIRIEGEDDYIFYNNNDNNSYIVYNNI